MIMCFTSVDLVAIQGLTGNERLGMFFSSRIHRFLQFSFEARCVTKPPKSPIQYYNTIIHGSLKLHAQLIKEKAEF